LMTRQKEKNGKKVDGKAKEKERKEIGSND
jgi:hypothetical protein